jgi:hypothetical protein
MVSRPRNEDDCRKTFADDNEVDVRATTRMVAKMMGPLNTIPLLAWEKEVKGGGDRHGYCNDEVHVLGLGVWKRCNIRKYVHWRNGLCFVPGLQTMSL